MATLLKLIKQTFNPAGSADTLNMLSGVLQVKVDGWSLQSCTGEGDPVWDTFELVGRGTSDSVLGTAIYGIQEFISGARQTATNTSRDTQYWLHYKPDNGVEVRTLVTDGSMAVQSDPGKRGLGVLMDNDGFVRTSLALQHKPWWEATTKGTMSVGSASIAGDSTWFPSVTGGDLPARVSSFGLIGPILSANLDDVWIGFRPTYSGISNYDPWWECEYGSTAAGGGGTIISDAAASNGTILRVAAGATAAMVQRMRISVNDVVGGGTAQHFNGKYLVLGRMKCGASTEYLVDLYQGLQMAGTSGVPASVELVGETKVTSVLYKMYEFGQVQIPPFGSRVLDGGETDTSRYSTIYLYAQRLSGTSYLDLDALCLMPCEHLLAVKNAGMAGTAAVLSFFHGADDNTIAYMEDGSGVMEVVEHSVNNFTWPTDGGVIVVCGQDNDDHDMTIAAAMELRYYPRYGLLKLT